MASSEDIIQLLEPRSTVSERVRGLLGLGLNTAEIGSVVGVSASAVRNWSTGQAAPRSRAEAALDDLRAAVKVLLDGGLERDRAASWLKSRNPDSFDDQRPIDAVATSPMQVLAAAHHEALEAQVRAAHQQDRLHLVTTPDSDAD